MVGRPPQVPECGDVVWVDLDPQAGRVQAGRWPAVVVSPGVYNRKAGLALLCPITTRIQGYPFEVLIPEGLPVTGAILSDHVKSLDWKARNVRRICRLPLPCLAELGAKLQTLIS